MAAAGTRTVCEFREEKRGFSASLWVQRSQKWKEGSKLIPFFPQFFFLRCSFPPARQIEKKKKLLSPFPIL